jgi:hypothetical protein
LVGRCQQHRPRRGLAQAADVETVLVDGNRHRVQACAPGDDVVLAGAGILQRNAADAVLCQRREGESQPLPETRNDDGVLGARAARPDTTVVGGDNLPQVPRTGRVLVTQLGGW